jgi:hypothetical protein
MESEGGEKNMMSERTVSVADTGKLLLLFVLLMALPVLGVGSVMGQDNPAIWASMTGSTLLIPLLILAIYWSGRFFLDLDVGSLIGIMLVFHAAVLLISLSLAIVSFSEGISHVAPQIAASTVMQVALLVIIVFSLIRGGNRR